MIVLLWLSYDQLQVSTMTADFAAQPGWHCLCDTMTADGLAASMEYACCTVLLQLQQQLLVR
jgi:hypothetical protein